MYLVLLQIFCIAVSAVLVGHKQITTCSSALMLLHLFCVYSTVFFLNIIFRFTAKSLSSTDFKTKVDLHCHEIMRPNFIHLFYK